MTAQPIVAEVIDGLDVFVCGLDAQGSILLFNQPCEQLTGLSRAQARGQSWLDVFAVGERGDHVRGLWGRAEKGRPAGPYETLYRDGRSLRWQFSRWDRGVADPVALWAVGFDVTDERAALARSRELERMVALGNLVAGLTHELRNPLNGALLQLAVAERHVAREAAGRPAPAGEAIGQATAEIKRIAALLDDFLVFARPLPLRLQRLDIQRVVARALDRVRAKAVAAGVTVALDPGEETFVQVDGARVEAAAYQLIANAIDATAEASLPAAERTVRVRVDVTGNAVAIEVVDPGPGVSDESPIFEPFYTTKRGGTGLGLTIVERVAADHGGAATYDRCDGRTLFRLELPIAGGARN